MKNKNRPISPHLQIYKPQITSILSISHRFTGIILYLSTFLISFWLFCTAFNNNLKDQITYFLNEGTGDYNFNSFLELSQGRLIPINGYAFDNVTNNKRTLILFIDVFKKTQFLI